MNKEKNQRVTLARLAKDAGVSMETARAIGAKGLMAQKLDQLGHTSTRCEDASGYSGYTRDLEADLEHHLRE